MIVWLRAIRRFLGRHLLALPAWLALGAVILTAVAALTMPSRDALVERYAQEAERKRQARDYPAALVGFERLSQLEVGYSEHLFGLVNTLDAMGRTRRALAIARQLAPADRQGYPPAQLWLGRKLSASATSRKDTIAADEAEKHLRQVPETHPMAVEAHALLGSMLLGLGRPVQAERELKKAADDRPEIQLLLTQTYLMQGRTDSARDAASNAADALTRRLREHPDDVSTRLNLALALILIEQFERARSILDEGLRVGGDPRFHRALASLYQSWADQRARISPDEVGPRLELIEQGLRHDPANEALLMRLARTIETGGPEADRAREALRSLLGNGKACAGVHFALGIDAWERGDQPEARTHWEHALRLNPKFAAVANNLAWLLAHAEPPDLDRALKLISIALDAQPDNPLFRDTRGRILLRLQKWSDALADLEAVLASANVTPGLHEALADAYDHSADPAMAAEHRRRARNPSPR